MQLQIGVKVIIKNSQGLYLLVQRTDTLSNDQQNAWDIPGGRIEPTEDLATALAREVREEINVELTGAPKLLAAQDIFVLVKNLHVVRLTYLVQMDIDDVTLSSEHQAHTWVHLAETTDMNIEPYLKEVLTNPSLLQ